MELIGYLPDFGNTALAERKNKQTKKSVWSVAPLIMHYLHFHWPLKCSLQVLEPRATAGFQIQRTNDARRDLQDTLF